MVPEQIGAERMDGASPHELRRHAQVIEPRTDFFGGLVGEREGIDPRRVEALVLDEEPDPLDEAIRLAGTGARQH
jgi:hypothetical protein